MSLRQRVFPVVRQPTTLYAAGKRLDKPYAYMDTRFAGTGHNSGRGWLATTQHKNGLRETALDD